jgi:hypothetical protein
MYSFLTESEIRYGVGMSEYRSKYELDVYNFSNLELVKSVTRNGILHQRGPQALSLNS